MPFALRNTYAHFKRNPWCGGLTGELRVERPYRNFLTSVQYMEWKVRGSRSCGRACGRRATLSVRKYTSAATRHSLYNTCPAPALPQVSHLLNKPIESICGYLTVLPGAFSAFRWAAVEVRCRRWAAAAVALGAQMPQALWARKCWAAPRAGMSHHKPVFAALLTRVHPLGPPRCLLAGRAAAALLLRSLLPERPVRL